MENAARHHGISNVPGHYRLRHVAGHAGLRDAWGTLGYEACGTAWHPRRWRTCRVRSLGWSVVHVGAQGTHMSAQRAGTALGLSLALSEGGAAGGFSGVGVHRQLGTGAPKREWARRLCQLPRH